MKNKPTIISANKYVKHVDKHTYIHIDAHKYINAHTYLVIPRARLRFRLRQIGHFAFQSAESLL